MKNERDNDKKKIKQTKCNQDTFYLFKFRFHMINKDDVMRIKITKISTQQ